MHHAIAAAAIIAIAERHSKTYNVRLLHLHHAAGLPDLPCS